MSNSSIWPMDKNLTGTTTQDNSGPGSNTNEETLPIPQSSRIGSLPSDCLVSNVGHSLGRGLAYLFTEMQSVYSTAAAD